MPLFTCEVSWTHFLNAVSLPAAALLSATAAWVASRTRSISLAVLRTLWSQPQLDRRSSDSPGRSASRPVVRDRRRS
jgi:hypothetical protein